MRESDSMWYKPGNDPIFVESGFACIVRCFQGEPPR